MLSETVNGIRISDHNGIIASFHLPTGLAIGGVAGENAGTLRRALSFAAVSGGETPGAVIGRNNGAADRVYGTGLLVGSGSAPTNSGTPDRNGDLSFPWELNRNAGRAAFTVQDGATVVAGNRGLPIPVRLPVNGEPLYVLSGSAVTLDTSDFTDPVCALNGIYFEGTTFTAPDADGVVTITENTGCTEHNFDLCVPEDETTHRWVCGNNPAHFKTEPHRFAGELCADCGAAYTSHPHRYEWQEEQRAFVCAECGLKRHAAGDIDGDGVLTTGDVVMLLRYLNGWDVDPDLDAADFSGDKTVSIYDAILILRVLAGLE